MRRIKKKAETIPVVFVTTIGDLLPQRRKDAKRCRVF